MRQNVTLKHFPPEKLRWICNPGFIGFDHTSASKQIRRMQGHRTYRAQGVMIPALNITDLMLKKEIMQAVNERLRNLVISYKEAAEDKNHETAKNK